MCTISINKRCKHGKFILEKCYSEILLTLSDITKIYLFNSNSNLNNLHIQIKNIKSLLCRLKSNENLCYGRLEYPTRLGSALGARQNFF
jgi:hypothetical protein